LSSKIEPSAAWTAAGDGLSEAIRLSVVRWRSVSRSTSAATVGSAETSDVASVSIVAAPVSRSRRSRRSR
jgi:hypothetical protein